MRPAKRRLVGLRQRLQPIDMPQRRHRLERLEQGRACRRRRRSRSARRRRRARVRCISSTTSPTVWSRCSDGQQIAPLLEQASSATTLSIRLGSQTPTRWPGAHAAAGEIGGERIGGRQQLPIGQAAEPVADREGVRRALRRGRAPANRSCRRARSPRPRISRISSAERRVRMVFMRGSRLAAARESSPTFDVSRGALNEPCMAGT